LYPMFRLPGLSRVCWRSCWQQFGRGNSLQTDCSVYICHAQHVANHNHLAAAGGRGAAAAGAAAAAAAGCVAAGAAAAEAAISSSSSRLKAGPSAAEDGVFPAETTKPFFPCGGSSSSSLAGLALTRRNSAYQTWSRFKLAKEL
jgi:hypothetical protein